MSIILSGPPCIPTHRVQKCKSTEESLSLHITREIEEAIAWEASFYYVTTHLHETYDDDYSQSMSYLITSQSLLSVIRNSLMSVYCAVSWESFIATGFCCWDFKAMKGYILDVSHMLDPVADTSFKVMKGYGYIIHSCLNPAADISKNIDACYFSKVHSQLLVLRSLLTNVHFQFLHECVEDLLNIQMKLYLFSPLLSICCLRARPAQGHN